MAKANSFPMFRRSFLLASKIHLFYCVQLFYAQLFYDIPGKIAFLYSKYRRYIYAQAVNPCGVETYALSYLNQACRDAGAGRDDGLETAVVHHEVTNCNERRQKCVRERTLDTRGNPREINCVRSKSVTG